MRTLLSLILLVATACTAQPLPASPIDPHGDHAQELDRRRPRPRPHAHDGGTEAGLHLALDFGHHRAAALQLRRARFVRPAVAFVAVPHHHQATVILQSGFSAGYSYAPPQVQVVQPVQLQRVADPVPLPPVDPNPPPIDPTPAPSCGLTGGVSLRFGVGAPAGYCR